MSAAVKDVGAQRVREETVSLARATSATEESAPIEGALYEIEALVQAMKSAAYDEDVNDSVVVTLELLVLDKLRHMRQASRLMRDAYRARIAELEAAAAPTRKGSAR